MDDFSVHDASNDDFVLSQSRKNTPLLNQSKLSQGTGGKQVKPFQAEKSSKFDESAQEIAIGRVYEEGESAFDFDGAADSYNKIDFGVEEEDQESVES
jgi:hypothetical protein